MIVLGAILLILGYVFPSFHILWVIGVILLVGGAVMCVMGSVGRPVGGRRHYY